MPRILRIINRLNLGGPTFNVAYLSKYLSPGYETLLVSGIKEDSEASSEFIVRNLGLEPLYIDEMKRSINPLNDYLAYKRIKNIIRDFKPDIVHTHAAKAGALGRMAAAACNVPLILHTFHGHVFHSYFHPLKTKVFIQTERFLAKKSSCIIAISEKQKEELGTVYNICSPSKIAVVPLGFDLSKFREQQEEKRKSFREFYQLDDDTIAIGIIGRIVAVKNHELFLKGLKNILTQTTLKVRAFIVGDGEDRSKTEAFAEKLQIEFTDFTKNKKNVPLVFTSWLKDSSWVYAGLDIVALTSLNEGTPVSLIEAQAAGKPIVSTQVGGIENIVIPDVTAVLSKNNDTDDFTRQLLKLVHSPELRRSMKEKGWEHIKNRFHYTRLVNDMRELYEELAERVRSNQ